MGLPLAFETTGTGLPKNQSSVLLDKARRSSSSKRGHHPLTMTNAINPTTTATTITTMVQRVRRPVPVVAAKDESMRQRFVVAGQSQQQQQQQCIPPPPSAPVSSPGTLRISFTRLSHRPSVQRRQQQPEDVPQPPSYQNFPTTLITSRGMVQDVPVSEADRNLAVAIPVPDDDDALHPRAVAYEYDPASGKGRRLYPLKVHYQQLRFRRLAWSMTVVLVMLTIGITLLVLLTTTDTMGPYHRSSSIRPETTSGDIQTTIQRMVGTNSFSSSSPYEQALQWILYDDPLALTSANATLLQRYLSAYVYFATSTVNRPWKWCNPPSRTNPTATLDSNQTTTSTTRTSSCSSSSSSCDSCTFLELSHAFYNQDTYQSKTAFQWLSNTSECQWAGVSCDAHGQIVDLDLSEYSCCFKLFIYMGIGRADLLASVANEQKSSHGTLFFLR